MINNLQNEGKKPHPDQKYIIGLVRGDDAIINEIFRQYYPQIEVYVLKNNGNVQDAKDLFNDSLKIIYLQGKKDLILHSSFIGFLKTICKRRWINELKRQKRFTPDVMDQQEPVSEEDFGKDLAEQEKTLLFRKHFKQLPNRCRQILKFSFEEMNYREIAEKLNLNYSFVRRRAGQCIKTLTAAVKADPIFKELN